MHHLLPTVRSRWFTFNDAMMHADVTVLDAQEGPLCFTVSQSLGKNHIMRRCMRRKLTKNQDRSHRSYSRTMEQTRANSTDANLEQWQTKWAKDNSTIILSSTYYIVQEHDQTPSKHHFIPRLISSYANRHCWVPRQAMLRCNNLFYVNQMTERTNHSQMSFKKAFLKKET